jgi:hypothetical protein
MRNYVEVGSWIISRSTEKAGNQTELVGILENTYSKTRVNALTDSSISHEIAIGPF